MGMGSRSTMANGASSQFKTRPVGPYSLEQSVKFLEGFAARGDTRVASRDTCTWPFVPDGAGAAVGVCVRAEGEVVVGEIFGEVDAETVRTQVARILSLDVEEWLFAGVGYRDPVVGRLQELVSGVQASLF